jgi:hypothetical protein
LPRVADNLVAERAHNGAAIEDPLEPTRVIADFVKAGDQAPRIGDRGVDRDTRRELGDRPDVVPSDVPACRVESKRNPVELRLGKISDALRRISLACRNSRFSRSRAFSRSATSLGTPGGVPLSTSDFFTQSLSVCAVQTIFAAIE